MVTHTFGPLYHDYAQRLKTIPQTDDALVEFGKDLERDTENGALSAAEQDELVTLFAPKCMAVSESLEKLSAEV